VQLDIAHNDIDAVRSLALSGFKHGISLADARGIAKENLELSSPGSILLRLRTSE
jgi:hypothetical protein